MNAKTLDVAIYLRKSRADLDREKEAEDRGQKYDTLESHRSELLSLVKREEYNLIDIYEEIVSGQFIAERPEMQRLLQDLNAYDAVLVMDIDRLGRGDKVEQGRIERAFKESGTIIITPTEAFDLNSESGELAVDMRTFISNIEFRQIKKRLQGGKRRAAKKGKDIGRKPPYGYDKGQDKMLVINEEEAKIVRLMFQWCIEGDGRVKIADRLTEMGIPSPTGKPVWSHVTVRKILANPKYKGDQVYGRVKWTKQENGTYKTKLQKDPNLYTAKHDAHDAIIDPETWQKAQEKIENRKQARVNKNKGLLNPFASIIKCKKCGKAIVANNPTARPNKYLFCGTIGCKQRRIVMQKVEEEVLNQLQVYLEELKAIKKLRQTKSGPEQIIVLQKKRIEKIEADIKKLKTRRKRIHESYEDGTYDKDTFLERNKEIQEELTKMETDLEMAISKLNEESSKTNTIEAIPVIQGVLDRYKKAVTVEEQNQLLKSIIKEIRYLREPEWKGPFQFELEIELLV